MAKKCPGGDDHGVNNSLNREQSLSDLGFCRALGEAPFAAVTAEGVFGQRVSKTVTEEALFDHPFSPAHFAI